MRTPSLRRRVTRSGLVVFVLLVVLFDLALYSTLRAQLQRALDGVLASRVELVTALDEALDDDVALAERLAARGVPAVVTTGDGRRLVADPVPRFELGPAAPVEEARARRETTTVELASGSTVEVAVSRAGSERTLRRVLLVTIIGTLAAILAAIVLFRRSAALAIAPLDEVVAAARRTTAGHTGERLAPDDPTTELGRLATAYDQMLDTLETSLDRTRRAEERTRRFLDDAAHQLRTPLAATRASVEALLRESDPEVRDMLLASLVREVARADRLLGSLLTLARLEGGAPVRREPTDLVALCADEVDRCRSLAPHLEVTFHAAAAPATLPLLDGPAIREAVANVLDNARRHADTRIDIELEAELGQVVLRLRDDGPGLAPEDAARAFQRFASLDGRGGSGLGLPISRAIAETHGGTLEHDGEGFVLCLPVGERPANLPADVR